MLKTLEQQLAAHYPAHFYRLQEIHLNALECAPAGKACEYLIIPSHRQHFPFREDCPFPYRVSPSFNWWVPLTSSPQAYLIITSNEKPLLLYYQPTDFWHAITPLPITYWTEYFEYRLFNSQEALSQHLQSYLEKGMWIGEPEPLFEAHFRAHPETLNPEWLVSALDYHRAYKSDYEIACLKQATDQAVRGHLAVREGFERGLSSLALRHLFCSKAEALESYLPYEPILGVNESCAILHNHFVNSNANPHSLLIDAGVSFNGYASDITRTYCRDRYSLFYSLIEQMDTLQQTLCASLRVGDNFTDLNEHCHWLLAEILSRNAILRASQEEIYDNHYTSIFLPHGLGHLLGLQVHDAGGKLQNTNGDLKHAPERHPYLRCTREVAPGMVLTIEPGLYFIDALLAPLRAAGNPIFNWSLIDTLRPYGGIRIEDNVIIDEYAIDNLTRRRFDKWQ